jgi:hypothetical protein
MSAPGVYDISLREKEIVLLLLKARATRRSRTPCSSPGTVKITSTHLQKLGVEPLPVMALFQNLRVKQPPSGGL